MRDEIINLIFYLLLLSFGFCAGFNCDSGNYIFGLIYILSCFLTGWLFGWLLYERIKDKK